LKLLRPRRNARFELVAVSWDGLGDERGKKAAPGARGPAYGARPRSFQDLDRDVICVSPGLRLSLIENRPAKHVRQKGINPEDNGRSAVCLRAQAPSAIRRGPRPAAGILKPRFGGAADIEQSNYAAVSKKFNGGIGPPPPGKERHRQGWQVFPIVRLISSCRKRNLQAPPV